MLTTGGRNAFLYSHQGTTQIERQRHTCPITTPPGAGGSIQYLHPAGLRYNPAYTNVVMVTGPATTIYIGAQGPLDAQGNLVGKGDIGARTDLALQNVQTALAAAGARLEHVIKWSIYLARGQPLQPGIAAFQRVWGKPTQPAREHRRIRP